MQQQDSGTVAQPSTVRLVANRQLDELNESQLRRQLHFNAAQLKYLRLEHCLKGHDGCVNCLEWSKDGQVLASGSDDTCIRIWNPFANRCLHEVFTRHIGNIFSVKFIGDGSMVATGAGDHRVIVTSITNSDQTQPPIMTCTCHLKRVKRLANCPLQSHVFWSVGEDGLVIQFDMREPHVCSRSLNRTVYIDLGGLEGKCVAVNKMQPHLIGVGADDPFIRIYDRRYLKSHTVISEANGELAGTDSPTNALKYYSPGHLCNDMQLKRNTVSRLMRTPNITDIRWDSRGRRLLANIGNDHIYLFDDDQETAVMRFKTPQLTAATVDFNDVVTDPTKMDSQEWADPHSANWCEISQRVKTTSNTSKSYDYAIPKDAENCCCAYFDRARKLMNREWTGDVYAAALDFYYITQRWPNEFNAYLGVVQCAITLKFLDVARDWLDFLKRHEKHLPTTAVRRLRFMLTAYDQLKEVRPETTISGAEFAEALNRGHLVGPEVLTAPEQELRDNAADYSKRFVGHCNTTTDIKEANFLGQDDNFICAGSDDGMIFFWDCRTTELVTFFQGDQSIVNCVQPHPRISYLASSGIDSAVKIWTPSSMKVGMPSEEYQASVVTINQERMRLDPFEMMLANIGMEVGDNNAQLNPVGVQNCITS